MGKDNHKVWANTDEAVRYLGVWFAANKQTTYTTRLIKSETDRIVNLLKHKMITAAQVVYINNRILISRIEYWTKQMPLSDSTLRS